MPKLIFHKEKVDFIAIQNRRLSENAALTDIERWKKAFVLMALAAKFRKEKGLLKQPQRRGVVLKRKGCEFI